MVIIIFFINKFKMRRFGNIIMNSIFKIDGD